MDFTRPQRCRRQRTGREDRRSKFYEISDNLRRTSRNVKRWQSGDMALRWTAAGMLEAEQQFRKVIGYRDLAKLAIAVERDLTAKTHLSPTTEQAATLVTA
jgi:putative transposase